MNREILGEAGSLSRAVAGLYLSPRDRRGTSAGMEFDNVTLTVLANVYFDGKVVSHAFRDAEGNKKSAGIIFPGEYHFGTSAPERMEIIAGACEVVLDGEDKKVSYEGGSDFAVPGESGFTITVPSGSCQYICSYMS